MDKFMWGMFLNDIYWSPYVRTVIKMVDVNASISGLSVLNLEKRDNFSESLNVLFIISVSIVTIDPS